MESRFIFLEDDCPELAEYGRKAEECITSDPNICLLCLGRIAELITEKLCRHCNITDASEKLAGLAEKGMIDEDISRKISSLTETKNDAANQAYNSGMACKRLMVTAEELCRWFITEKVEGRFAFLADLFPPDKPVPMLMNFSELGREAEENLFTNTRYCLICLGDMGEAAADRIISDRGIETHERDQIDRIDVLAGKIPDEVKNILHALRIARNKAIHERYNDEYTSEAEGRRLLDDALTLCEWLFLRVMKAGYVVKARVTGESDGGYSAVIGRIRAQVPASEVPRGRVCIVGKKYVFKVMDSDSKTVRLSLSMADRDYNLSVGRLYAKYKVGQDVHVTIKSLSNSTGAIVELRDGLEARIPPSELGRKIYRRDEDEKMVRYEVTARVKWFSLTQYPPMLLSVKDVEDGEVRQPPKPVNPPKKKPAMSDVDFRVFCRDAAYEKIVEALDNGANPNSTNGNNTTALMMAAQFNKNPRVVKALIDAGADIDAQNHKGNTALMYAAMSNVYDVVRMIYDSGADIELVNSGGKKACDFAVTNKKLNDTDMVRLLRDEPEETLQPATDTQDTSLHETASLDAPLPDTGTHEASLPDTDAQQAPLLETDIQNPTPETDTQQAAFPDTDTQDAPLPQTDTHEASLPEADTHEASLPDTDTHEASLPETASHEAPLPDTDTHEASLPDTDKHEASLPQTDSQDAPLPQTDAHEAPLPDTDTQQASLPDTDTQDAPLPDADSQQAPLPDTNTHEASLPETASHEAPLHDTDKQEAPLSDTASQDAPLPDTDTHEASLPQTDVHESPLPEADSQQAPLPDTDTHEASLPETASQDAPLPDTDTHEAHDEEPTFYEYTPDDDTHRSHEDAEAIIAIRKSLQRNFLKICRSGTEDEIAEAVSAGVNVNVTNKSASTALMFAAKSNTAQAVEILIHAGACINSQDDSGNTALIYAAAYNNDDVIDTLIDAGADTNIQNFAGHKALDYARKNHRLIDTEAVKKL